MPLDDRLKRGTKSHQRYPYDSNLSELLEIAPEAVVVANPEGDIVLANERAEKLLGYKRGALPGIPVKQLMPERFRGGYPDLRLAASEISSSQLKGRTLDVYALKKDGSEIPVEIILSPLRTGEKRLVLAVIRDISERLQAETEQRRVNRALRAISECNQALIHAEDEPELLQKICDIAIEAGGYRMAWVGYAEDDESKTVRPVAHAGYDEGYLKTVNASWADTERGRGPTGTAIRTGKTCFIQNFATDPSVKPWREQAMKLGYACSIALPLTSDGRTFGALTIYSRFAVAFHGEERALLEQLAGDLSFGISGLRARKARREAEKELRESEERFRQMVDHLQEVFWMANATGSKILYINPAYEKIWRRSRDSLYELPFSWMEAIHPEDRERMLRNVKGRASEGEFKAEYRIVLPEGSVRHIWHRTFPIRDESGNIRRVVGIAEDITQRKQAEEDLRFRAKIIDQIHDSVVSTDLDGHVTSWNKGAERLFGYSAEETIGKHISFVYPEDQHASLEEKIIAPLKRKGSNEAEVRMRKKSGEEFFAHLSTSLLRDNHGAVVGMIGYTMDISTQVRGREKLEESEKRYRELTESITDVFVELDSDLRYTYWNRAAEKLTGIPAKDVIGKSFYGLFPKARRTKIAKQYLETLRTHRRRSFEAPFEIHGEEYAFEINTYPSKHGLSVVAKNVTERKRSEEALRQQANLLEQSHDAIIVWEFPGKIVYWNRGAEQLYGFSREEALGRRTHELLRTEHAMPTEVFEAIIERKGTWAGELTHLTRDGREILVESRQVLMREAEGRRLVLETNRDITERALAQQASRAQTKALVSAMQRLTMGPELGRFMDEILLAINREFRAHSSTLWLYDPATKTVSLGKTAHHDQILKSNEQLSLPNALKPPPVPRGTAAGKPEREPFIYSGTSHPPELDPRLRTWMAAQRVKSILCVPLFFGKERIGYLTVHDSWREYYTAQEKQLAQALAQQVTLALVLARLTEREQQAAILEERNRMAREIHDTLAQNLDGIILQLEVAEDDMSANPEAVGPRVARVKALAREAHAEARRSVWALRSSALESGDLPSALRQFCNRTIAQAGTKVEFTLHGSPRPLPPDAENHLLRIGQEAVTNALKHAGAKRIRIRLRYEPERVALEVKDDGKGFRVKESRSRGGVGLSSMRERSKLIGASLRIKSSIGSGTQVIAQYPTPRVAPDETLKTRTERSLSAGFSLRRRGKN